MPTNLEEKVRKYLKSIAQRDYATLGELISSHIRFRGPTVEVEGSDALISSLQRISAVHVDNVIQKIFVDGDDACVIYDFVTDTLGGLPTVEWLHFEAGRIASVALYYDQMPWQTLRQTLTQRATQAS